MKSFGVYIPEQDASWEREGDIFDGIYERHGHCDADQCTCPDGRRFDEDYTIWEIVSLEPSIEDVGKFLRFLTPPLSRRQLFTTIRRQIWQIFDPFPLKNADVLNGWSLKHYCLIRCME